MVIRAWTEAGSAEPLRAQVRVSADTAVGFDHELVVSDPAEVEAIVRAWLDGVVSDSR